MTKEEKYSLAKWAMSHALKNGAQEVSVNISSSKSSSVEVREDKIDKLEQAIERGLSIRLFVDKKYSAHSTNRLKQEDLAHFIEQAIEGTKYLSEDEFRSLPEPELYYKGDARDLKTLDLDFDKVAPQKKIDLAFAAEKEAYGKDERVISVSASYYDGLNERIMVTSNGFEGDTANSHFGMYSSVSVKSNDARPESSWSESAIFFDKLKKENIGTTALKRAIDKIGQKKIASGTMTMIVENKQVGRILGPLMTALSGSAIQQKNSFLIDKLGQKVVSEKLTITDDPFIIGGRGSKLFDSEGLAAKKRPIFENGVLKTYFIDTYYGKKDLQGLLASVKKGILVTGFNGGNSNGTSGDFSYGIEGFLVENGAIVQPVSEMNITGNMKSLWSNIGEIGNDFNDSSSWLTPSIVFEGVDFSGV